MKKKILSVLKVLFFLSIGGLFIWLFMRDLGPTELNEIKSSFRHANYWWVVLTILLAFISHVLRALRWQLFLAPMGYKTRFKNVFMSLMIGYLANLALPRLGEITRCTVMAKYEKVPFEKSLGTVVAERALDLVVFFVLFLINLIVQYDLIHQYVSEHILRPVSEKISGAGQAYLLYGVAGAFILLLLVFFIFRKRWAKFKIYQKISALLRGFIDGLKSLYRIRKPITFTAYTIMIWVMYYLMTYLCFFTISDHNGLTLLSGLSVLVLGTIGIMVVQGGIGIYPAIVAETLSLYGAVPTTAYALGWLIWCAQTAALVLAGVISIILLPFLNRSRNEKGSAVEK